MVMERLSFPVELGLISSSKIKAGPKIKRIKVRNSRVLKTFKARSKELLPKDLQENPHFNKLDKNGHCVHALELVLRGHCACIP